MKLLSNFTWEKEEEKLTWIWWYCLSLVSVINILIYLRIVFSNTKSTINRTYEIKSRILSGLYVFVCAFRSFLPRIDIERVCIFDLFLSSAVVGRSLATVAELCFIYQLCILINELAEESSLNDSTYNRIKFCSNLIFWLIFLAEILSWIGVLTKFQLFNCGEESLWLISVLIAIVCLAIIYNKYFIQHI